MKLYKPTISLLKHADIYSAKGTNPSSVVFLKHITVGMFW